VTKSTEPFYDISLGFPSEEEVISEINKRVNNCAKRKLKENGRSSNDERKDSGSSWLDRLGFSMGYACFILFYVTLFIYLLCLFIICYYNCYYLLFIIYYFLFFPWIDLFVLFAVVVIYFLRLFTL
jgi:hypothetical protein